MIISQLFNLPLLKSLPLPFITRYNSGIANTKPKSPSGCVYLVGSGPGDPELLTLKAHRLIQQANVILYDSLVSQEIVDMFPASSQAIYVGKRCGQHSMSQNDICNLMSEYASKGNCVVRVKGGDPAIFGRTAEETEHLQKHKIKFAIVPGVTAASGCSAWSGLPLTHREEAHSVRFITAHFNNANIQPDWKNYAESNDTLVFYMGLSKIRNIAINLISHGKDSSTPMAVVDQGTTKHQTTLVSTLAKIEQDLIGQTLQGPALVIVGNAITHQAAVKPELLQCTVS